MKSVWLKLRAAQVAEQFPVSAESLIEAWYEMEQYQDICFAERGTDLLVCLGYIAGMFSITGKRAGEVLRTYWSYLTNFDDIKISIESINTLDETYQLMIKAIRETRE